VFSGPVAFPPPLLSVDDPALRRVWRFGFGYVSYPEARFIPKSIKFKTPFKRIMERLLMFEIFP
jgi:hypothetical protein